MSEILEKNVQLHERDAQGQDWLVYPLPPGGYPLAVNKGGTGAQNAASARAALGITPANIGAAASGHGHALTDATITGTLPLAKGGTGATDAATARTNLGAAASGHAHALTDATITGTLPLSKGGTGATDAAGARNALGLGNTSGALPVANGGTGQTTVAAARNGYRLEHLGRTNKKNQPVRDLVVDEDEAVVVRQIFHLLADEGYGTVRVANWLNDRGIKTKRDTTLWRGTAIRALIDNPIYIGMLHMGDERSKPFDAYKIIDDDLYERCLDTVRGRSTRLGDQMKYPEQTASGNLLSGFVFCAHCGNRLSYSHNTTRRKLADGTIREYDRDLFRYYRKINARESCDGMSAYKVEMITEAVLGAVRQFFSRVKAEPKAELLNMVCETNTNVYQVAYRQAEADYQDAHKQIISLEEQAVKAITGENSLDIGIINSMIPKYRAKFEKAKADMDEARSRMDAEKKTNKTAVTQVQNILEWADIFEQANKETRHMILARLIDRVEVGSGYRITIKFKISYEQFMGLIA